MKIFKVIDVPVEFRNKRISINGGEKDGLKDGDKMVIYRVTDKDIIDKDTGKNYGKIEYLVGYAVINELHNDYSVLAPQKVQIKNMFDIITGKHIMEPQYKDSEWSDVIEGDLVRIRDFK